MKSLRLGDRELGSEFCRFERDLIFKDDLKDVGFVRYVDQRAFRLMKSRFTDIDSGKVYILPTDGSISPDEGAFVRVEVGREAMDHKPPGSGWKDLTQIKRTLLAQVDKLNEPKVPLPPPNIPVDEFISRVSADWRFAEEDLLDKVMSLLLVSAPASVYGKGGLGSEGLETMRAPNTGTPKDVSQSIMTLLPVEFRTSGSSQYRYSSVDSLRGLIELERARVREDCYSIVRPQRISVAMRERKIPVQLPFVLRNAELKRSVNEVDLDVLDYQLTALYMPPPPEGIVVQLAEKVMRSAFEEAFFDLPGVGEPDPLSSVKLGLAVSRLHVGRQFTGSGYSRRRTDVSEGQGLLSQLLKRGLEEMRIRMDEERVLSAERSYPWKSRLQPVDRRIYLLLREKCDEQGIGEVPRESIMPEMEERILDGSIERLSRYGYVLLMKRGTMIRPIVLDHPEDLG
jgi:hypothetical protein